MQEIESLQATWIDAKVGKECSISYLWTKITNKDIIIITCKSNTAIVKEIMNEYET